MKPIPQNRKAARRLQACPLTQKGWPQRHPLAPASRGLWVPGQVGPRKRVAEVMRLELGVVYHPTHVGRLLPALRWSPRKPRRRARQRDEVAIAHWHTETWLPLNQGLRGSRSPASA